MRRRAIVSAAAFFCLLCSCGVLRPLRGAMGVGVGVGHLPWLMTATFAGVLVSALVPRALYLIPLGIFCFAWWPSMFFVWFGVFNVGAVALFWTSMNESFDAEHARRYFGLIAAGGTLGAIVGPVIALVVAKPAALIAIGGVLAAIGLAGLRRPRRTSRVAGTRVTPLQIALPLCYTVLSTFLYFAQAEIVGRAMRDVAQRTSWFASIDLASNVLSLLIQLFGTAAIVTRLGLGFTLAMVPALVGIGFVALGAAPSLVLIAALQIIHRAGSFAIMRPAREMLFAGDAYAGKSFIDTVIYRCGDVIGAWMFSSSAAIAPLGAGIAFVWMIAGFVLGRNHDG
jgi:ATP:ADP antiporter, AAA family